LIAFGISLSAIGKKRVVGWIKKVYIERIYILLPKLNNKCREDCLLDLKR
jgi:hypothetical protein